LTIVVNSLYNVFAYRYCWYRAVGEDIIKLFSFDDYVSLIVLGDDSNFSVHPDYRDLFNEITIHSYMKEINLIYTNEHKVVSEVPLRKLTEVDFLSRSYRFSDFGDVWLAPQDMVKMLCPLHYTLSGANGDQISMDKVDSCLRELALHGKEEFNKWSGIIISASKK
jgi:hypothetical protein